MGDPPKPEVPLMVGTGYPKVRVALTASISRPDETLLAEQDWAMIDCFCRLYRRDNIGAHGSV